MSRKNANRYHLLTNQSLASSFQSEPTMIAYMDNISYQIDVVTSDSIGEFKIQASNNFQNQQAVQNPEPGTWVDLPLGGPTSNPVVNAANDVIIINLNQLPFNAVRIVYTASTPGTGTCSVTVMEKML